MKNFWKIVMLTVLCVSLLCGVTAMAEVDRFQFEKTNLTVFEGNTLELSLIRQGNCAADGELTFVSGRENIATVDENGTVTALKAGTTMVTASIVYQGNTYRAVCTLMVRQNGVMRGDLNGDGTVDAKDVTYLRRALAKWEGYAW